MQINSMGLKITAGNKNCTRCRYYQIEAIFENDRLIKTYTKCRLYNTFIVGHDKCKECVEKENEMFLS